MLTYIINKYFFLFLVFSFCAICNAQDTIFTKTSDPLLVRVLEITKLEVSYKNFYNPDGVIRSVNNEQIVKIVYENGTVESKFQLKQKTSSSTFQSDLFVIEGKHIALNNVDITHKAAFKIMMKRDFQSNSEDLNGELVDAESKRNGQITCTVLAPTFLLAGVYFARQHRYNIASERTQAKIYLISGLTGCLTSIIGIQIYKSFKNKHIRKAALLYNKEIFD